MNGFIVIDKPEGLTSHDIVARLRKILGTKKIGHTGTLDPFATGVLPVAVGEGTKAIQFLDEGIKEYVAILKLGEATDTQDCEGTVTCGGDPSSVTSEAVTAILQEFTGEIEQVPPMYSAIKKEGVPLYRLARQGVEVERAARKITVYSLVAERVELPFITLRVRCSRGTYVRTIGHDIGGRLGCGGHLTSLRRTASGPFVLADARSLEEVAETVAQGERESLVVPLEQALGHLPEAVLTPEGARLVRNGRVPSSEDFVTAPVPDAPFLRLVFDGKLLAVASQGEEGRKLARGFNC